MKTVLTSLICLFSTNVALAAPVADFAANYDGLALGIGLLIGAACLIVARHKAL